MFLRRSFRRASFFCLIVAELKKFCILAKKTIMKEIKFDKAEEFEGGYTFDSVEVSIFLDDSKKKAYIFDADECEVTSKEVDVKLLLENESILNQLKCEFCDNTKGYDASDDPCIERMEHCECEGMNHELQEFYDSINK